MILSAAGTRLWRVGRGPILLLALGTAAWAQSTKTVALNKPTVPPAKAYKIAPQTFRELEKRFDARLESLVPDANAPVEVLGFTRGVYVEDCGVVFTAEVSLVKTPGLSPFLREIPKEMAERVHNQRVDRLPLLKAAMREMLDNMSRTFMQIPPGQKVVLAVRLLYGTWESTVGMPSQVMMSAVLTSNAHIGEIKEEVQ
jgi:hypothetical protein